MVQDVLPAGALRPVRSRAGWMAGGLAMQFVGLGMPLGYVLSKARHEDLGGVLSTATVRLAWHESLHARAGIGVLAAGAAVFAVGSVLLARPFVRRRVTLLVAVPTAAVVGGLVMGAAALLVVVAVVAAMADGGGGGGGGGGSASGGSGSGGSDGSFLDFSGPGGSSRRRKRRPETPPQG